MNKIKKADSYEIKLDLSLQSLYDCQKTKEINSCMKCEKLLDCQTRNLYVNAVYNSMSKGKSGGFEF